MQTTRMTARILVLLGLWVLAPSIAIGQEAPDSYAGEPTWRATMLASRDRFLARHSEHAAVLSPWYATAPLPAKNFAEVHVVVEKPDLTATDASGKDRWRKRPGWSDGAVHNLPKRDRASTYLYRRITVEQPLRRTASLGSDDGIEVWLNGARLLSKDVPRGPAPDQNRAVLELQPGVNHLVLKIHNRAGGYGFYFALRDAELDALWEHTARTFPAECARFRRDLPKGRHLDWFRETTEAAVSRDLVTGQLKEIGLGEGDIRAGFSRLVENGAAPSDPRWLETYEGLCRIRSARATLDALNLPALRRAIVDLSRSFPKGYPEGAARLTQLAEHEQQLPALRTRLLAGSGEDSRSATLKIDEIEEFRHRALLDNPLLDFERLLIIKRRASSPKLGLPQNWQGNCSVPRQGFDDELAVLSPVRPEGSLSSFFHPDSPRQIADVDLHFDADRMLFSMLGSHDRWQIFELAADGETLRQVTPGEYPDVDNYDACYLPDERIIFDSTRCFQGIPCVGGADQVANLFLMDARGENVRQLCFDQDHDWCPTVLNDGRVLFSRWEYSDTPHYFSRLLFHMNPDGTGQMEFYGSNSYWPNSIFYARPIPGHATQVVGIVGGHHGVPRMGELVLFDTALGRFEADGVVQRIPGWGEDVEPVIKDQLVDQSWPRFLHPWPLSEKHFIVTCRPSPDRPWGIWLVDVFDNMLCLAEEPGFALMEPIPFRSRVRPPRIPDKVKPDRDDAAVFMADIYRGPGLAGVPRGTVKALRVYEFHYGYNKMGGHKHVGIEGPWDVHRILGTVPVLEDGSAGFKVPANTPLAVQPLDADGQALQVMRSWFTAMPGETLSCLGCHEPQNTTPPVRPSLAARRPPEALTPWHGPVRGFSFTREVQPVLDRKCVGCHDGSTEDSGRPIPDFRRSDERGWGGFTPSYIALHPYVRRPGPESDYHLQKPLEWHASTSELVQMLRKGHHGVRLDGEDWERLYTWIDLNVPDHGTWGEHSAIPAGLAERRREMRERYAGRPEDLEAIPDIELVPTAFVEPVQPPAPAAAVPSCPDWPFDADEARERQSAVGLPPELKVDLGDGIALRLVLVPAGSFVMGTHEGAPDEGPPGQVQIERAFYLGVTEVTRAQFNRFDSAHHNGYHDQNHKDHTTPGYPASGPKRPAIRISWQQARAFCAWLATKTGHRCDLPTEAEWEWACRAGAATPFSYGDLDTDFAPFANLADLATKRLAVTGVNPQPIKNPNRYEDWLPKDARFDDGQRLMCDVGRYRTNAWGLHDMHGNVCEWTRSDYLPYPIGPEHESLDLRIPKVVRGGSWHGRPKNARSAWRWGYRSYQPVYDVGFRVAVYPEPEGRESK